MNIRKLLADSISRWRNTNNKTYFEMSELTGLNRNQLIRIINENGEGVSVDLMEKVCKNLGYDITLEIK